MRPYTQRYPWTKSQNKGCVGLLGNRKINGIPKSTPGPNPKTRGVWSSWQQKNKWYTQKYPWTKSQTRAYKSNKIQKYYSMLQSIRSFVVRRLGRTNSVKDDRKVVPEEEDPTVYKMIYGGEETRDKMCSICHEEWVYGVFYCQTICNHQYHEDCLKQWFDKSKSCPTCRRTL